MVGKANVYGAELALQTGIGAGRGGNAVIDYVKTEPNTQHNEN